MKQHEETAAFCQLFNGQLLILNDDQFSANKYRMLELRGELEEESHLIEVKNPTVDSLRDRTSFLFFNWAEKRGIIWHGSSSSQLHKELIRKCVEKLTKRHNGLIINELNATADNDWNILENNVFKGSKALPRHEVLVSPNPDYTSRLFFMSSLYGKFEVREILNPLRCQESFCPFPFFQAILYGQEQPSLFMLDNETEIYLWQGILKYIISICFR